MEQIAPKTSIKDRLLPLPFFLLMTVAVVLMLGALLFLMYSIVLTVAFKSAMVFLIVFAASMICAGFGVLSLNGFFAYGKYYKKRKGEIPKTEQKPQNAPKSFKDYLTLQNIALLVLLVGAICAIISADLGVINRDKWVQTIAPYMEKNGYYADINHREVRYTLDGEDSPNKIVVELSSKTAVIIYSEDETKQSFVFVNGYEKYQKQIGLTLDNKTLTISEGEQPSLDGALEKLLFFMFDENKIEKQIKIYIPASYKDAITLQGEYIIAQ
ncbi:MAG: hypothetical protein J5815_00390 [Clostridia bacterium]|nr:hypothetical protein [Clostridia bacterium]